MPFLNKFLLDRLSSHLQGEGCVSCGVPVEKKQLPFSINVVQEMHIFKHWHPIQGGEIFIPMKGTRKLSGEGKADHSSHLPLNSGTCSDLVRESGSFACSISVFKWSFLSFLSLLSGTKSWFFRKLVGKSAWPRVVKGGQHNQIRGWEWWVVA